MVFDASTLLSRTMAGDAELRKASSGLSLGQRKLLGFLDQPQALEELADEHGLERAKLTRDLAKLASLNLVAVNGEVPQDAATGVVLSGLRAPTMLRWLFPLLLVISAAAIYFAMRAPAPRRPADASSAIASGSQAAAVTAAASVTSAPDSTPMQALALAVAVPATPVPALSRDKAVASQSLTSSAEARNAGAGAAAAMPARAADASKGIALPTRLQVEEAPRALPATERIPDVPPSAAALPKAIVATQATLTQPDASPVASTLATASAPVVGAPINAAQPAGTSTGSPAATAAIAPAQTPPVRLAMAAPTSAAAQPAPEARLLPLTRQDPEFPREALVRGVLTGMVKARLAIDAAGRVSAVSIVDARPSRVFDRAVSDALSHWTFPAGEPGRSTEVEIAFHRD